MEADDHSWDIIEQLRAEIVRLRITLEEIRDRAAIEMNGNGGSWAAGKAILALLPYQQSPLKDERS